MNDQFQNSQNPTPSLEEELDVLEAVYRVGKEKGMDLLRPEQMKKLMDAGRIASNETDQAAAKSVVIDRVIGGLYLKAEMEIRKTFSDTYWKKLSDEKKTKITTDYFLLLYGVTPLKMSESFGRKRL